MYHHPLLVMSLSGSIVVASYGLLYPVIKRYVSISWQRAILQAAIFFYLFPLPLLKRDLVIFVYNLFPILVPKGSDALEARMLNLNYAINQQPGNIFFGSEVLLIGIFTCCMCIITSFVVIQQIKRYLALSRIYRSTAFSENPPSHLTEQFNQIKNDLGIKRKVNFICSPLCKTPITIGVLSPTIIFPTVSTSCLEPICYTYILKHELLHIKSRDFLVKILSLIVLALHWYNPICYFLYHEICVVCEMNCDHEVVKDADGTVRRAYSNLILELATKDPVEKEKYAIGLVNGDAVAFERRILEMKTSRKRKSLLSCVILVAVCLIGSITAFAYEPPQAHKIADFHSNGEYLFSPSQGTKQIASLPYQLFFTDKEGNIYPLDMSPSKIKCNHQFVDGTLSEHLKNSNGGCLVILREAWRCSVCGQVETGAVISRTEYTTCPH